MGEELLQHATLLKGQRTDSSYALQNEMVYW